MAMAQDEDLQLIDDRFMEGVSQDELDFPLDLFDEADDERPPHRQHAAQTRPAAAEQASSSGHADADASVDDISGTKVKQSKPLKLPPPTPPPL